MQGDGFALHATARGEDQGAIAQGVEPVIITEVDSLGDSEHKGEKQPRKPLKTGKNEKGRKVEKSWR